MTTPDLTTVSVRSHSDPATSYDVTMNGSYPIRCSCPAFTKAAKRYRYPDPCKHMREASASAHRRPSPEPMFAVGGTSHYAASYEVTLSGVRFVGDVSERGTVRITAVERAGFAADHPLDAVTDDAFRAAEAALVEQARAMAARGEVDMFALPSARTWREDAITATLHAAGPNDRRAQREIEDLRRDATERAIAIAARCAGRVVAA